jgi:hypothetical protein
MVLIQQKARKLFVSEKVFAMANKNPPVSLCLSEKKNFAKIGHISLWTLSTYLGGTSNVKP